MTDWQTVTDDELDPEQTLIATQLLEAIDAAGGAVGTRYRKDRDDNVFSFVSVCVSERDDSEAVACCFKDGEVTWIHTALKAPIVVPDFKDDQAWP